MKAQLGAEAMDTAIARARDLRRAGRWQESTDLLRGLREGVAASPELTFELGLSAAAAGATELAIEAFTMTLAQAPDLAEAWRSLADVLRIAGREDEANQAALSSIHAATKDPSLMSAALALAEDRLPDAEAALRERLRVRPTDVAAIRMLGELAVRIGRLEDAAKLLTRAVELAPDFDAARDLLARTLSKAHRHGEVVPHACYLVERHPREYSHRLLLAAALAHVGDQQAALEVYADLVRRIPEHALTWMAYGHVLKTIGRQDEAVAAYRTAIGLRPTLGEAYWSVANLKTCRFADEDLAAMRAGLANSDNDHDRLHFHFALGKALEDAGEDEAAFDHYLLGNRIRRDQLDHDPDAVHDQCALWRPLLTSGFFTGAGDRGCPARDPIFIVGMPRAGSTLVEQILSSHSMIEGTMELPDMLSIAGKLRAAAGDRYPDAIADLDPARLRALGEDYLERTRFQRRTDKPLFIDKMPNNWRNVGLIRLILPNATIIDARRHPLACSLSCFKQHFASGQAFSYDLEHIGRYYRDYVEHMAAIDAALPGYVHRVIYEEMVANTRGEVERLLAHVGVPFEEACLSFWQTDRAVRTASSEQVRQPIYTAGLDHWRRFADRLGPLADSLGPVLQAYPKAPS